MCGKKYLKEYGNQKRCGSSKLKIGCSYWAVKNSVSRHNKRRVLDFSGVLSKRQQVRIKFDYTCQGCGLRNDTKGFLDIDHTDGDMTNNKIENLNLLCPNCHRFKTIKNKENIKHC